ncbi:MAG TPA: hypothetical protein V6C97_07355, partial [Oculatellaceae cyanobacterium]
HFVPLLLVEDQQRYPALPFMNYAPVVYAEHQDLATAMQKQPAADGHANDDTTIDEQRQLFNIYVDLNTALIAPAQPNISTVPAAAAASSSKSASKKKKKKKKQQPTTTTRSDAGSVAQVDDCDPLKPERRQHPLKTTMTFCADDNTANDAAASQFLQPLFNLINWRPIPIATVNDTNSILRSLSLAMWGTELYWRLLRDVLYHELFYNETWYRNQLGFAPFGQQSDAWDALIASERDDTQPLDPQHILELSN